MDDDQEEIRQWIRRELEKAGRGSRTLLANFLKVRPDAITRMLNTHPGKELRDISFREIMAMQRFFGSSAPGIDNNRKFVPISGLAGAGPDGTVLFATGDGNFGTIQAPEDSDPVAALEVRGNSMYGLANDGWIIFFEDRERPNAKHHIGEMCVCWLKDERVLVKIVQAGSQPGLFTLESASAPPMRDVELAFVAVVTDIKTRRAAEKYIRRNPHAEIEDLPIN